MDSVVKAAKNTVEGVAEYAEGSVSMFAPEKRRPPPGAPPSESDDLQFSDEFVSKVKVTRKWMTDATASKVVVHDNDHEWVVKTWREAKAGILGDVDNSLDLSRMLHPWEYEGEVEPEEEEEEEPEVVDMSDITCPKCNWTEAVKATDKPSRRTCRKCSTVFVA